jgi:sugar phosphate isomerase/epimerase
MGPTITMSTEMAYDFGTEETLKTAKNLGFSSVELTPVMWESHYNAVIPSTEKINRLKDLLDKYEMDSLSASIWYLPDKTWEEEKRFFPEGYKMPTSNFTEYSKYLEDLVNISSVFGIKVVNFFIFPFMGQTDEITLKNFVTGTRKALAAAEKHNVYLCMEQDVLCNLLRSIEGLERIISEINHPRFKITFDPSNLYMSGIEPFPYAYSRLKKHIHHVHLRNSCIFREGDPSDERFFPFTGSNVTGENYCRFVGLGHGALNIYGLLEKLIDDSFNGIIALQPMNHDFNKVPLLLKEDSEFINNILGKKYLKNS